MTSNLRANIFARYFTIYAVESGVGIRENNARRKIVDKEHLNDRKNKGHFETLRGIHNKIKTKDVSGAIRGLINVLKKNKMAAPHGLPLAVYWAWNDTEGKKCFEVKIKAENAATRGRA